MSATATLKLPGLTGISGHIVEALASGRHTLQKVGNYQACIEAISIAYELVTLRGEAGKESAAVPFRKPGRWALCRMLETVPS